MLNKIGFEYLDKKEETVFETFLKYTNEKEKSSMVLGKILEKLFDRDNMVFLDVGSGNGEYLKLSLNHIKLLKKVELTLLEPSDQLIKKLRLTVQGFPTNVSIKIIHSTLDNFTDNCLFDVILASHLPFSREKLPQIFSRMLDLLKECGFLIVVLRRKDDIHEFRTMFKTQLLGKYYSSLNDDDAIKVFNTLAKNKLLKISTFSADAELYFPIIENREATISIIEFLLNKKWEEFPDKIRESVLAYINQKNGVFHQIDGFVLVQKM